VGEVRESPSCHDKGIFRQGLIGMACNHQHIREVLQRCADWEGCECLVVHSSSSGESGCWRCVDCACWVTFADRQEIIQTLESVTQNKILSRYEVDMLFFPQALAVLRQKVITCLLGIIELKGGDDNG